MLKKIAIFKALDIEIKKQRGPLAVKEAHRGHHSLKEELSQPGMTIIAEVAGGNPARGLVRENFRPGTHAKSLVENGARALAVATDRFLYFGEDKHLVEVRSQVKVPLIRRDFIFEEYQVEESKILGADAVVLMPALLTQDRLQTLAKLAVTKGLDVIAETVSEAEIKRAMEAGIDIICVLGRDLDTWEPSWDQAMLLLSKVPSKCLRMVEASISTLQQIRKLEDMGVHGVVIGDALLEEFYPGKRLAQILAGTEPARKPAKGKVAAVPQETPATITPTSKKGPSKVPEKSTVKVEEKQAKSGKTPTLEPNKGSSTSNPARKGHKEPPMAQPKPTMAETPAPVAAAAPAAKKPAAKKAAAPKKAAVKKAAAPKKAAAKKAAPKKAAAKKAAPKKAAAKKAAPKKAAAKKAAPKKAVAKKAAPKKAAAKKAAPKKAVAKKAPAKKK